VRSRGGVAECGTSRRTAPVGAGEAVERAVVGAVGLSARLSNALSSRSSGCRRAVGGAVVGAVGAARLSAAVAAVVGG
jgi:hypothetical protein